MSAGLALSGAAVWTMVAVVNFHLALVNHIIFPGAAMFFTVVGVLAVPLAVRYAVIAVGKAEK